MVNGHLKSSQVDFQFSYFLELPVYYSLIVRLVIYNIYFVKILNIKWSVGEYREWV